MGVLSTNQNRFITTFRKVFLVRALTCAWVKNHFSRHISFFGYDTLGHKNMWHSPATSSFHWSEFNLFLTSTEFKVIVQYLLGLKIQPNTSKRFFWISKYIVVRQNNNSTLSTCCLHKWLHCLCAFRKFLKFGCFWGD